MGFTTIRVDAKFAAWLKIESAKSGLPMYVYLESLAENALGGATPWESVVVRRPTQKRPYKGRHRQR